MPRRVLRVGVVSLAATRRNEGREESPQSALLCRRGCCCRQQPFELANPSTSTVSPTTRRRSSDTVLLIIDLVVLLIVLFMVTRDSVVCDLEEICSAVYLSCLCFVPAQRFSKEGKAKIEKLVCAKEDEYGSYLLSYRERVADDEKRSWSGTAVPFAPHRPSSSIKKSGFGKLRLLFVHDRYVTFAYEAAHTWHRSRILKCSHSRKLLTLAHTYT
jgi:hypothetical protein